ncbi:CSP, putative [Perkinsus marinus ATCC 50983]|uniref:CSP, putative n=1 Tax=Perkinsus marinus (strain ATCC 50983 / TXsc) TaxID=423536 RepID=C5KPZ1_PERM5|nr:CSP, putative [Perkinsus marinus ATCC 50983]EER13538.1 CSP, putative [Perkinsus marinus ATCC 50983]|eukprot:XP_002781743.1 CSP, putative [Perkinsus marinus ATCC 50983]
MFHLVGCVLLVGVIGIAKTCGARGGPEESNPFEDVNPFGGAWGGSEDVDAAEDIPGGIGAWRGDSLAGDNSGLGEGGPGEEPTAWGEDSRPGDGEETSDSWVEDPPVASDSSMSNPFGGEGGGGEGDGSDNAADRPPEGASGNPFGSADASPFGSADASPFGSADASPFGSADANPFGGADANPFGGAGEDSSNSAGRDALGSPNGALGSASRGVLDGVVSGQDGYPLSRAGGGFRGSPGEALDSGGVLDGPRRDSLDSLGGPGSTDRPTSTTSAQPTALAGLPANVGIVPSLPTRAPSSGSSGSGMNPVTRGSPEGRPKRDLRTPLAESYRFTDKSLNPSLGEELEFAPDPWSDGMGGVTRKDVGTMATGNGNWI